MSAVGSLPEERREHARKAFLELPPADRTTLARCSALPLFDAETYTEELRAPGGGTVAGFIEGGVFEILPGGDGKFRVRRGMREVAWASWTADQPSGVVPPALGDFAASLAVYCGEHGLVVDQLRAFVLADQDEAATLFAREFDSCAARMDLAGCRNLLDVLADPMTRPFLARGLVELRNQRKRVLFTREVLRASFLGSTRYLHRPKPEAALEKLLTRADRRALRLTGGGGYGKSTLLHWFIAQRCVQAEIACARVDFDVVEPVNATRFPFLTVLEIAYQLNGQLEGAPFEELLRDHSSYRRNLTKLPGLEHGSGSAALGSPVSEADAEDVLSRFHSVLEDIQPEKQIVIVVDTFEEAALRPAADAVRLVDALIRLHDQHEAIRIVVSGRLTEAEQVLATRYRGHREPMFSCRVKAFSPQESADYLTLTRKITQPDLVEAIVRGARGVPWQLALQADVVDHYPGINVETLTKLDFGVAWAVDRVIGRIDNVVLQWLVRYGAVPRHLSRRFARDVLLPRISRAVLGFDDRPQDDPLPPQSVAVFSTNADVDAGSFDDLWDELTRYAATTSWMWIAPKDDDAVVFHAAVREPMRRLIARHPVHALLHQDAVDHFERLAEEDEDCWARWTAEALYHRFQLDPADAARSWREAIAEAARRERPEWASHISAEILGPEYVDDEGVPRELPGVGAVVDQALLAQAHVERAWASATLARSERLPGADPLWNTVETSIGAADRLGPPAESSGKLAAARAALLIARGSSMDAVVLLQRSAPFSDEAGSRLTLLAEALRTVGLHEAASRALAAGLDIAVETGSRVLRNEVSTALAGAALRGGKVDEAESWIRRVNGGKASVNRLAVQVELAAGRPRAALNRAAQAGLLEQEMEALILLGRPRDAVTCGTHALDQSSDLAVRASVLTLRALAHAEQLCVDRALDDLHTARRIYRQMSDFESAGMTSAHAARIHLSLTGNLREAGHVLDESDRFPLPPDGQASVRCALQRAALQRRMPTSRPEPPVVQAPALRGWTDPRAIVDIALAMAAVAPELEAWAFRLFERHLPKISPAVARLSALNSLEDCPAVTWGSELLRLVLPDGELTRDDLAALTLVEDRAWVGRRMAELLRVAGRPDEAAVWARASVPTQGEFAVLGYWKLLRALGRAEVRVSPEEFPELQDPELPMLTAAYTLTLAGALIEVNPVEVTTGLLDRASDALVEATQRDTKWRWQLLELRRRLAERLDDAETVRFLQGRGDAVLAELGEKNQSATAVLAPEYQRSRHEVRLEAWLSETGHLVISSGSNDLLRLPPDHPLLTALRRDVERGTKSPVVRWVSETVRDAGLFNIELDVQDQSFDLRIVANTPLAQLPWELMTVREVQVTELPGAKAVYRSLGALQADQLRVRVLQEALADAGCDPGPLDGYLGPQTREAVRTLQRQCGLPVDGVAGPHTWRGLRAESRNDRMPSVLIVQRDLAVEVESSRGYSHVGAEDLVELYDRLGWRTYVVRGPDVRWINEIVPAERIDVLHINASVEVSGSVPYLDFGAGQLGWSEVRSEEVSVSDLDGLVHRLADRGRTPLVVLDVAAAPKFTSETVRQLLLRNDLAHQLMTIGRAHSVLATGLATESANTERAQQELVRALTEEETAADVVQRLHRRLRARTRRTALFTALRPDLMPRVSPGYQALGDLRTDIT